MDSFTRYNFMLLKLQNNMVPELYIFMIVVITNPSFCLGMSKFFMTLYLLVHISYCLFCLSVHRRHYDGGICGCYESHSVLLLIRKVTTKRDLCNLFKQCSTKSQSSYHIMNIWLRTKWHLVSTDVIMSIEVPCSKSRRKPTQLLGEKSISNSEEMCSQDSCVSLPPI